MNRETMERREKWEKELKQKEMNVAIFKSVLLVMGVLLLLAPFTNH